MSGHEEYRVHGPPGTGKTTYLTRQCEHAVHTHGREKVLVASLTKAAATEIASRQDISRKPSHMGTLHALCYHALGNPEIADTKTDEWEEACKGLYPLTKKSMSGVGIDTPDEPSTSEMEGDRLYQEMGLLRARLVPYDIWPARVKHFAKLWNDWKDNLGYFDFTDLLERCLHDTVSAPGNPNVMIGDESQDWSKLELKLFAEHWGRHVDTLVLAGDADQALYTWRGAAPELFADVNLPEECHRELTQSYRVPKKVQLLAQKWIRQIKNRRDVIYNPRDEEGEVTHAPYSMRDSAQLVEYAAHHATVSRESVMILTSCGYMLNGVIAELKRQGIAYHNPYRKRRGDWNPLATRKNTTTMSDRVLAFLKAPFWSEDELAAWLEIIQTSKLVRGTKARLKNVGKLLSEPLVAARVFLDESDLHAAEDGNLDWLLKSATEPARIEYVIKCIKRSGPKTLQDAPRIIIGTIHSVKGGEADTVILAPDLSPQSMRDWVNGDCDAIIRQYYVGATRARQRLVLLQPSTRMSVNDLWQLAAKGG